MEQTYIRLTKKEMEAGESVEGGHGWQGSLGWMLVST